MHSPIMRATVAAVSDSPYLLSASDVLLLITSSTLVAISRSQARRMSLAYTRGPSAISSSASDCGGGRGVVSVLQDRACFPSTFSASSTTFSACARYVVYFPPAMLKRFGAL